jgi:glycosyltransferase involved in cell wall biosynthesis
MAAVMREQLASPLAERYELEPIVSYDGRDPLRRLRVFVRSLATLARWCRGDGRRLVHIHTAVRGSIYRKALCVAVARAAGRPVLLQLHAGAGDIEEFARRTGALRRRLLGAAMRGAGAVVSVSGPGAREIERWFGVENVIVVPNAAPSARPPASPLPPHDGPTVLYMGGFVGVAKGGALLVEALPSLLERSPDVRVVVAGTGEPPAELAELAERAPERVAWIGWLDAEAKARQLSSCDVFVMPSLSEGMPIALLEAMSYGRAIVASDVGGIPDVVTAGEQAILVPPGDRDALVEALARTAGDAALRERLGAAALERVAAFDGAAVYERLAGLYDDLLAGRRPAG